MTDTVSIIKERLDVADTRIANYTDMPDPTPNSPYRIIDATPGMPTDRILAGQARLLTQTIYIYNVSNTRVGATRIAQHAIAILDAQKIDGRLMWVSQVSEPDEDMSNPSEYRYSSVIEIVTKVRKN
ncbi:MAG: hypothetical protein LBJ43_00550 [Propionibacteriaceae bacterium]|jgi:hypothetical protein|nr:hypothetical protein [Propionibacteriaceae bacterium]